jgi:hypothetical protein
LTIISWSVNANNYFCWYNFGHVIMFVVLLQCKTLNIELERTLFNMPNTMITNKFMHFPNIMRENKNVTSCISNGLAIMNIWSIVVLNRSGVNSRTRKINMVVPMWIPLLPLGKIYASFMGSKYFLTFWTWWPWCIGRAQGVFCNSYYHLQQVAKLISFIQSSFWPTFVLID